MHERAACKERNILSAKKNIEFLSTDKIYIGFLATNVVAQLLMHIFHI